MSELDLDALYALAREKSDHDDAWFTTMMVINELRACRAEATDLRARVGRAEAERDALRQSVMRYADAACEASIRAEHMETRAMEAEARIAAALVLCHAADVGVDDETNELAHAVLRALTRGDQ